MKSQIKNHNHTPEFSQSNGGTRDKNNLKILCRSCKSSFFEIDFKECCKNPDLIVEILGNDREEHKLNYSRFLSYRNNGFYKSGEDGFYLDIYETPEQSAEIKTLKPTKQIFLKTKKIFQKYLDTSELNYNLLAIWTLGTYSHNQFETFPLLILTARKQSGKTRTLKLISSIAQGSDGSISTSVTETALFRHEEGAVFFDEMESLGSREKGALRETINAVYKKGNKIVRYSEKKVDGEKKYVENNFHPFYPLGLANIYGFGDVLSDRSLQIILQRSDKKQTKLIEDFSTNKEILELKKDISSLDFKIPKNIFSSWNDFIETGESPENLRHIFKAVSETGLVGRPLELFFSLFVVADLFGILKEIVESSKEYQKQQEGEFVDNIDDLLNIFIEKSDFEGFVNLSDILKIFRQTLENPEDWVNSKWLGRALKRLGFINQKRMVNGKVQVILKKQIGFVELVDKNAIINPQSPKLLNNNSTNSTNTINHTNSTNSTKYNDLPEFTAEGVEI